MIRQGHVEGVIMQLRSITAAAVASSLLAVCGIASAYDYTAPVPFHPVATFDPANGVIPFPNNLLLLGTTDLTLNIPVADPDDFSDPKVAMNALDGFSTVAPWSTTFNMPLSMDSIAGNIHVFQVNLSGPGGAVTGVVRELASPQEFVVALAPSDTTGRTIAIVPTKPLAPMTSYMAVLTTGIEAATGEPIRASLPYLLAKRTSPLCSGGASTVPALPASQACALEPLRQLTNAQEAAAAAADDPTAPLTNFWHAAPGAYVDACAGIGLDPDSTNLTYCNPLPVATSTQLVPVVMTIPNARSGRSKPATGWPIVIYQHGITRNRTDMFAVAGTLAAQGFAAVAIDLPLHGITDTSSPFYVGNTPFAALGAKERTFDLDFQDNSTGATGPDGAIDPSGSWFINLSSLLTSRDNLREGVADLFALAHAIPSMHVSAGTDFDGSRIAFVGQSLGSIVGTMFVSLDPHVNTGVMSVPGGGIARLLDGSPTFGPRIRAGLAAAGVEPGSADYDAFMSAAQTVIDSGDPINFNLPGAADKRFVMQEVIGGGDILPDQVIPNSVPGAPLSGTEPLIAAYGLAPISQTTQSADGIRGAVRLLQGEHGSLLDPTDFPLATAEMQGEMASMVASGGAAVQITYPSIVEQPGQ
jgi:dienelactone hydrolase